MTESLVSVGLFIAVIACLPMAVKWFQQRTKSGGRESVEQSRVISAVAVGPHQRVVTVEVGPENARVWLTLGVTPQTVSCLYSAPVAVVPHAAVDLPPLHRESV
jgi:flagellar protein FliO/FliZ